MADDYVKLYEMPEGEQIVPGELLRIKFPDGCGFVMASSDKLAIIGKSEPQTVKCYCAHMESISFVLPVLDDSECH